MKFDNSVVVYVFFLTHAYRNLHVCLNYSFRVARFVFVFFENSHSTFPLLAMDTSSIGSIITTTFQSVSEWQVSLVLYCPNYFDDGLFFGPGTLYDVVWKSGGECALSTHGETFSTSSYGP